MAMPSAENSDQPAAISTDADQREHDNLVPNSLNHEVAEPMPGIAEAEEEVTEPKPGIAGAEEEVTEPKPGIAGAEEEVRGIAEEEEEVRGIAEEEEEVRGFSEDEVRGVLEVIASTGKFWHDWDKLRSMISFYLKQVLSEYPEAKTTTEEQNAKLGETYPELVKRLDEALHSFEEGPPFTLQRLCEILLSARSIYPNLSKLALALEKNLLVTSTLTVSTDPYPQAMQKQYEPDEAHEEPQLQPSSMENGIEPMAGDGDEIMAEVQEADIDDDMTIDMEAFEEIVGSSEQNSTPTGSS